MLSKVCAIIWGVISDGWVADGMDISWDKGDAYRKPYRISSTNIYRTKDDRFYHLHGKYSKWPSWPRLLYLLAPTQAA